jgi:hypothetical protein
MIYKIPIYFEIQVEGDFAPADLNEAVDQFLYPKVWKFISQSDSFKLDSKNDIFDETARKMVKATKTTRVRIRPIQKSQVIKKIVE